MAQKVTNSFIIILHTSSGMNAEVIGIPHTHEPQDQSRLIKFVPLRLVPLFAFPTSHFGAILSLLARNKMANGWMG